MRLTPSGAVPKYEGLTPFAAIVAVEADVTREWQRTVSKWLVDAGCLYMLAWGRDCSSWDDSVDYANLEAFDYGEIPDDRSVMTTWHENEPLSDVFDFAKRHMRSASHAVKLKETVLVHVSFTDKEQQFRALFSTA